MASVMLIFSVGLYYLPVAIALVLLAAWYQARGQLNFGHTRVGEWQSARGAPSIAGAVCIPCGR
jgi:hypothetical protein